MNTYIGCGDKAALIFKLVYVQMLAQVRVAVTCIWLLLSDSKIILIFVTGDCQGSHKL